MRRPVAAITTLALGATACSGPMRPVATRPEASCPDELQVTVTNQTSIAYDVLTYEGRREVNLGVVDAGTTTTLALSRASRGYVRVRASDAALQNSGSRRIDPHGEVLPGVRVRVHCPGG